MRRWLAGLFGLSVLGCAGHPIATVSGPAPVEAEPAAESVPVPPPPDLTQIHAPPDTAVLRRLAGDSLQDQKDREILERLHDVSATPADDALGIEAEVDLAEMFDINVARYAEHDRVKFYLDFFQGPARERMAIWLGRLPVYEPMIRAALVEHKLPQDLVYLALIESGYSNTAVSRSKAVGMWQFMRPTAREYGMRVDHWVDERRDPVKATRAAARFLADLTRRFNGSHYLAAAAYNGGGGTVSRGLRKLGSGVEEDYFGDEELEDLAEDPTGDDRFFHLSDSRYLRKETKDYVPKLIAAAMIAKQPTKYGFAPIPDAEPYAVDSIPVTEPTSLDVVAKVSGVDPTVIGGLNPHYLRGVTPPGGATWWIRVPAGFGVAATEAVAALGPGERIPGQVHVVRKKETLRSIGRRYGLSVAELTQFNPGLNPKAGLKAGTELRIPGLARVRSLAAADERQTSAARARATARGVHRVRAGETLGGIARRYGMTLAQIRAVNELGAGSTIRVGQRLRVGGVRNPARPRASSAPARAGTKVVASGRAASHVVRRGETLSSLARKYGVSVEALMSANGLRSARGLQAGRRLTIPG